jgi:CBS-domain-containing membrane protein
MKLPPFCRQFWADRLRGGASAPPRASLREILLAGIGGMLAISLLALLTIGAGIPALMAPLGASCFLVFAVPESPFAQPRSLIGGHLVSSAVGLVVLAIAGPEGWAMGFAVGLAIIAMQLTRTGHPPAGADPLVVLLMQPDWHFLVTPVLIGSISIVGIALLFNNLRPGTGYPRYWGG